VRGLALPGLEPLVAGAGEGGEAHRVAVAVLPLGGLAGGGEQFGRDVVLAAGRRDEGGGEPLVRGVQQYLVVGGQSGGEARSVLDHPGRTDERAQQCHGVDH
jgi:hypothetical protein